MGQNVQSIRTEPAGKKQKLEVYGEEQLEFETLWRPYTLI